MDRKLTILIIIFLLVFTLFISYLVLNKQIVTFTRAAEELIPSTETSLIFAWPLTAKSNGLEKVEVNVFIRNYKNVPLVNKKVNLITNLGSVSPDNQMTDKLGKATFSLTSNNSGIAEIKAVVDDKIQIKQTVSIKFVE